MLKSQTLKYGIFSWYGFRAPMKTRIEAIERAGYAASSIWRGRTEPMVREGNEDLIPEIFRDLGLAFEYVHGSYTNCNKLWSESREDREIIFQDYSGDIEYCRRHRVPNLVVHISKGLNPRPPSEAGLEVISRLVAQAEESGVRLAVENTRQPGHIDYILERLESPALGFCYDSSHDFLHCDSPGDILARWGHRLFVTHLSDNDGLTDKHWMPGAGNGDWSAIARAFPAATFNGFLTLEVLPKRYEPFTHDGFLEQGVRSLQRFERLVLDAEASRTAATAPSSFLR